GVASSTPATVSISIIAVNDAPSFTSDATLATVNEDATNPPGASIATLFAGKFSDPDAGASLSGVAVTANTATAAQGKWQYSTDSGVEGYDVGVVSNSAALALSAATLVRFLPAADFNGTPAALVVRALDNTYSGGFTTEGTIVNDRVFVDTTTN